MQRKWTIISPVDDFSETDKVTPATEQHLPTADDTLSRHTTLTVKVNCYELAALKLYSSSW